MHHKCPKSNKSYTSPLGWSIINGRVRVMLHSNDEWRKPGMSFILGHDMPHLAHILLGATITDILVFHGPPPSNRSGGWLLRRQNHLLGYIGIVSSLLSCGFEFLLHLLLMPFPQYGHIIKSVKTCIFILFIERLHPPGSLYNSVSDF